MWRALAFAAAAASALVACGGADERPITDQPAATRTASTGPGQARVVLSVRGMYCQSCERTVTAMLQRIPGVQRAEVSVNRGEAVVLYDPSRTSAEGLITVLERLGYQAAIRAT